MVTRTEITWDTGPEISLSPYFPSSKTPRDRRSGSAPKFKKAERTHLHTNFWASSEHFVVEIEYMGFIFEENSMPTPIGSALANGTLLT